MLNPTKQIMKLAKNTARNKPATGGLVMLIAAIVALPVFTGTSAPTASPDNELGVEVLSVSVSKLGRDAFGNAVSSFSGMPFSQGEGGVVVLAKITQRGSSPLKVQEGKCRLLSFKDDLGTVLSTNAATELGNQFFAANRPLEILTTKDPGCFGIKIRSVALPAPTANRLRAEVLLVFGLSSEERFKQKADVLLQTSEVVTVGPLKVQFFALPPSPSSRTNQVAAGSRSSSGMATASFLPDKDVAIASVAFFAEQSDEPILVVKDLHTKGKASKYSGGFEDRRHHRSDSEDSLSDRVHYGFTPPDNRKITIKVRYYEVGSLVEKHCVISTGLSP